MTLNYKGITDSFQVHGRGANEGKQGSFLTAGVRIFPTTMPSQASILARGDVDGASKICHGLG